MNKTQIDGVTLFVKKLTSLNPTVYKYISLQKALTDYSMYLFTIHDTRKQDSAKSFKKWCTTEI